MSQFLPGEGGDWPHAVLVEQDGADGVRFAREAAAILLCGRRDCACGVCRRVREGIHPDVQLLDRGERDIAVDDVRGLRRDAYVAPLESGRKVYIILHAQNMNGAAQNAALKLFEEPPEGVYFILLCDCAQALLQTVRSRCVILGGAADGGEEPDVDEEARALAREFAAVIAEGGELPLLAFCLEHEKLKRAQLAGFFAAVLDLLEPALRAVVEKKPEHGGELARLPAERIARLIRMVQHRAALCESNVGTAHLLGTIPAELFTGN